MEKRDLYDKYKNPTGKTFIKGEQVPNGYYYLIVKIIIENDNNEYLIQKRVKRKGGKWALTGGHPKAGETSLDGIITETNEEIGINIKNKNIKLLNTEIINDQIYDIYYLKDNIDIKDIIIQKEEVDGIKWATLDEINKLYKANKFHDGDYQFIKKYFINK